MLAVRLLGGRGLCACRWKRRDVVLPVCLVKTSLGSPWPAARALPRHAVQACAWASGECGSPPLPLPSLSGLCYWPSGHD
jgi:hypothetical protein